MFSEQRVCFRLLSFFLFPTFITGTSAVSYVQIRYLAELRNSARDCFLFTLNERSTQRF
jgi:hypothetical protein